MFETFVDNDINLLFPQYSLAEELFRVTDKNREFLRKSLPWLDQTRNVEDTKAFIKFVINQFSEEKAMECMIAYNSRIVGMVGFHMIDRPIMTGHIGYWLDEKMNGKGIITKSVRRLISLGFEELKLNKVEIRCDVNNLRSRAVPERLNLRQEGVLRCAGNLYGSYVDHVVYGILYSEWN